MTRQMRWIALGSLTTFGFMSLHGSTVAAEPANAEASRSAVRTDHLSQLPDPKVSIQDEPLTVTVPRGLPPLFARGFSRSAGQPFDQGQV